MGTFGSLLPVVKRVAAGPFETVTRGAVVAHLLKYRTVSKLCRTSAMCGIVAGRQCQACEHRKVECPHNRKAAQTSITLACHSLASRPFCRSLLIYLKGRRTEPGRERVLTPTGYAPKAPSNPGLGQPAARSWKLRSGVPHGWRGPGT